MNLLQEKEANSIVPASFRDPDGSVWVLQNVVYRAAWHNSSQSPSSALLELQSTLRELQGEGRWIAAKAVDPALIRPLLEPWQDLPEALMEHPRIFFPSYPYEWSPGMLYEAAGLTLDINVRLLEIGWELKDGTPSNILFTGREPIFVDHFSPSFRQPGQLGWKAFGQFIRTFLVPLCLHRLYGFPPAWMNLARQDGIPPEEAYSFLSFWHRCRPSIISMITMPYLLTKWFGDKTAGKVRVGFNGDETVARGVTLRILHGLQRKLKKWAPHVPKATVWSQYESASESYSQLGLQEKDIFINSALEVARPVAVLDLGCNTGRYSIQAAKAGAKCVAIDGDAACIDILWRRAKEGGLDILPLVVDLARPSPAMGWNYQEETPFLERVRGRFDMVFALALIHHLLVRKRIPLKSIVSFLSQQTTKWALVEWVSPSDTQFQRLAGENSKLYQNLNHEDFENYLGTHFAIESKKQLDGGTRTIYLLRLISAPQAFSQED